jgi:predicted nucleotidyltransferase
MRFKQPLDKILGQQSKIKVLRYLSQYPGEYTGREIARAVGLSHPIVHSVLASLKEEGVILMRKFGKSLLFSLAKDHQLVKEIIFPIFKKEANFIERITQLIAKKIKYPIESIILYGSIAKNKEGPKSDLDFLVVLPSNISPEKVEKRLLEFNTEIIKQYGNQLSPLVINKTDFLKRLKKKDKLLKNILKEGKVVFGKSISELIIK